MFKHISQCKFMDRKTGARKVCTSTVSRKKHRRGYCSVACAVGHTWVWCRNCCDCTLDENHLGCTNAVHWFERDSFDTGSRNHMQRHRPNTLSVSGQLNTKRKRDDQINFENGMSDSSTEEHSFKRPRPEQHQDHVRVGNCDAMHLHALNFTSAFPSSGMQSGTEIWCMYTSKENSVLSTGLQLPFFGASHDRNLHIPQPSSDYNTSFQNQLLFDTKLAAKVCKCVVSTCPPCPPLYNPIIP